ncbi:aspartate:alanine exchanger family transporter [Sanguibacter keddieii]|uniref:aspartate:alanine exchanger family transporter n=1 Tax=Sanguibacter keddieii TaxID=60920 RepID=UPI000A641479|nr:TrkA C-terminal domain-containing protein [Sanguibacter keddieii]
MTVVEKAGRMTGTLKAMASLFASSPLLALFVVVALGAAIGAIRIGPLRFGAAGALFVGLIVSAVHPEVVSNHMSIVQPMGLAFFVYCVGISAGATFFQNLRKQTNLLALTTIVCVVGAVIALVGGRLLGLSSGLTSGLFTGALTAAPALDTATRLTGDANAAVGYAFGYPVGVIGGILVVTITVTRKWVGPKDTPSLAGSSLEAVSIRVSKHINTRDIDAWRDQRVRLSYLRRDGRTRVTAPGEDLLPGDHVVMVGDPESIKETAPLVGEILDHNLEDDRSDLAFERIVVSNPDVAGRSVCELNVTKRFGAVITRVRRGDLDLLARDDLDLQLGDHVAVVVPTDELDDVAEWLGDSERRVAEVDGMAFGIGLVLGLLLGIVSFPLPGGQGFQLGAAAGPLIVGMLLGALRRTGPLVWTLPAAANLTIRQIGLMLFLAALGLNAGPQFASLLGSPEGWRAALLAAVMVIVCCVIQALGAKLIGLSSARAAGGIAGFLGQPAVLQAADARVTDERIEAAYATLFAFAIIVKILLLPVITSFL